jgi:hypothetical protein
MPKSKKIKVDDFDIALYAKGKDDFFSLTDMARYRDADRTNYIIQNWMRTRNAIEFNGLWEQLNNPDFKSIEFDAFKNEAGANSFTLTPQKWIEKTNAIGMVNVALFGKTAKQWREENAAETGNIRDHATLEQLVVLTNLESNNALLIRHGLSQAERLRLLNESAIHQMKSLLGNPAMGQLQR